MEIRKLESAEHGKTRFLWEKIFKEDSQTFVDYYYFIRTKENVIYVVEEDGAIRSMLQKNPYRMKLEDSVFDSEYIVGVATEKEYRSRGYMRQLLIAALEEENKKKHPFTFLMPAAEAIYSPYDFRYIYHQKQMELDSDVFFALKRDKKTGEKESRDRGRQERVTRDAELGDAERIAAFFEKNESPKWAVCTVRDSVYYQTKILEQQSESGGVRLIFEEKELIGVFFYAREEDLEILEPVILQEKEDAFLEAVEELRREKELVKILGCTEKMRELWENVHGVRTEEKPLIMARITHLPTFLSAMKVPEEEKVDCSFAVIDPLLQKNSGVWRMKSDWGEDKLCVSETEDSEGVFPIDALTQLLFGTVPIREIAERTDVMATERLVAELEKICKLNRVFLNEIV